MTHRTWDEAELDTAAGISRAWYGAYVARSAGEPDSIGLGLRQRLVGGAARPRESLRQGPLAGEVLRAPGKAWAGQGRKSEGSDAGAQAKVCAGSRRGSRRVLLRKKACPPLCRTLRAQLGRVRPQGPSAALASRAPEADRAPLALHPPVPSREHTRKPPSRDLLVQGRSSPSPPPPTPGCRRLEAAKPPHPLKDTLSWRQGPAGGWRKHGFQRKARCWPSRLCPHPAHRQGERCAQGSPRLAARHASSACVV